MSEIEILTPTLHEDERGSITTFLPHEPLSEYNLVIVRGGTVRGMHYHPHFIEYLLFVSGKGTLRSQDVRGGPVALTDIYPGLSTRAIPGVAHAIFADEDVTAIALLTRRWRDSDPPIVKFEL